TGVGLRQLKQLPLKSLSLQRCNLTDEGLAAIAELPHLEQLDLSEARGLTEAGLATLARCPKLYRLTLRKCGLGDPAIARLRDFPVLPHPDLNGNPISDQAISSLSAIPKLNAIWIGETGMTETGIARLKAALPRDVTVQIF